jgi:ferredoxin
MVSRRDFQKTLGWVRLSGQTGTCSTSGVTDAQIVVDWDECEANAVCEGIAPTVFQVDDNDMLNVLIERPGPELLDDVQHAVDMCPKRALFLKRGEA